MFLPKRRHFAAVADKTKWLLLFFFSKTNEIKLFLHFYFKKRSKKSVANLNCLHFSKNILLLLCTCFIHIVWLRRNGWLTNCQLWCYSISVCVCFSFTKKELWLWKMHRCTACISVGCFSSTKVLLDDIAKFYHENNTSAFHELLTYRANSCQLGL